MSEYRVLVPLDGSRLAEHALIYLDALRSMGESRVLLLSVVEEAEGGHNLAPEETRERESNLLSTYVREVASDVQQLLGIEVETKVASGPAAACILDEASAFAPDLLLIATHGRSGTSRWRFGSVADKVIRGAACNTLVVGPKASERAHWLEARILEPFRSVLVPLDGSLLAERALPTALSFADAYDSSLHLVRVVPIPAVADGFGTEASYLPQILESSVEAATTYLEETAARIERSGLVTDVLLGSAAAQLEDYVNTKSIDLVVMTSHGRSGFARTALGSVTDRLLGANAPVLVVRVEEAG